MQLTSESVMEAVEREERRIGKKSTGAFFAGTTDGCCCDAEHMERDIVDETDRECVYFDECQLEEGDE